MKFKKIAGFSLIEVMVAMGIMSLVAVGYMHLTQQRAKEERTQRINAGIEDFVENVQGLISTLGSCKASFKDARFDTTQSMEIAEIKNSLGIPIYMKNHLHPEGLFQLQSIKIEDIKSTIRDGDETVARLVMSIEKKGAIFGASQIKKGIDLFVSLNEDGSVKDCGPLALMGQLQKPQEISVGDGVTEELIEKAIKDNPELQLAKDMLKNMQENQKKLLRAQESLNELEHH